MLNPISAFPISPKEAPTAASQPEKPGARDGERPFAQWFTESCRDRDRAPSKDADGGQAKKNAEKPTDEASSPTACAAEQLPVESECAVLFAGELIGVGYAPPLPENTLTETESAVHPPEGLPDLEETAFPVLFDGASSLAEPIDVEEQAGEFSASGPDESSMAHAAPPMPKEDLSGETQTAATRPSQIQSDGEASAAAPSGAPADSTSKSLDPATHQATDKANPSLNDDMAKESAPTSDSIASPSSSELTEPRMTETVAPLQQPIHSTGPRSSPEAAAPASQEEISEFGKLDFDATAELAAPRLSRPNLPDETLERPLRADAASLAVAPSAEKPANRLEVNPPTTANLSANSSESEGVALPASESSAEFGNETGSRSFQSQEDRLASSIATVQASVELSETSSTASSVASPAPAESVPQFMQPSALVENLGRIVLHSVHSDPHSIRIELEPASLGRVMLQCRESSAGLTVEITVQSGQIRALLAAQEQDLRLHLESQGLQMERFSVACRDGEGRSDGNPSGHQAEPGSEETENHRGAKESLPDEKPADGRWTRTGSKNRWVA